MVPSSKILVFVSITVMILLLINSQIAMSYASEEEVCINENCDASEPPNGISPEAFERLKRVRKNTLWQELDKEQGDIPYGKVLDSGTGMHSLQFIASLADDKHGMTSYTAITGSAVMHRDVQKEAKELGIADKGEIILGNWFNKKDPLVLKEQYDTIIVDYLIGAMDAFSPYQQDMMLKKLVPYLKPGGRMYVIGLEPIPDYVSNNDKTTSSVEAGNIICQMRRVRDSCALLAGNRPYREYPLEWIKRQFEGLDDMVVLNSKTYANLWDNRMFTKQINNGRNVLSKFPTSELAEEMKKILNELEAKFFKETEKLPKGKVRFGFDYIVSAEKRN